MGKFIDLTGQRFGRLVVIKFAYIKNSSTYFTCKCDCGNINDVYGGNLRSGNTKSCGCLQTKHGMCGTGLYESWTTMIQRCTNKNSKHYERYGGRGITVCDRWLNFDNFYEDIGDRPKGMSLDRIDNTKGYSPDNCRWATASEQSKNTSVSRYWFIDGVKYDSRTNAAEAFGVSHSTIQNWCKGRTMRGGYYPPKPGCYTELKYSERDIDTDI